MQTALAHSLTSKPRTEDVLIKQDYDFNSLLLPQHILQGLHHSGFYKPSPVQIKAIPLGRCGLDLIVKAKSGTGKTVVFAVIALDMLDVSKTHLQVLVIAPTREIASQSKDVISTIGKELSGLKVECFIGGLSLEDDIKKCKSCHIAVGTPGRLKQLIEKKYLDMSFLKLFILDEADKLMEESFQKDINFIYCKSPERKQVLAMSATYANELEKFLTRYMLSPTFITPDTDTELLLGLRQMVTVVKSNLNVMQQVKIKMNELIRLLSNISFTQCLVFCNYQTRAESLSNILNQQNWNSMYISAAQKQPERLKVMDSLKKFQCRILLTTDLTARGIDASNVDLVVNFDVPNDCATYLHRMGRAGRYGSKGLCITISATGKEVQLLQYILGEIGGSELKIAKLPEGDKLSTNLWECDLSNFETLSGMVETEGNSSSNLVLKKSVLEMKQLKSKKKNEPDSMSEELEKLSVDENPKENKEINDLERVSNLLNEIKTSTEISAQKFDGIDSESLLKGLIARKNANKCNEDITKTESCSKTTSTTSFVDSATTEIKTETEDEDPSSFLKWIPVEGPSVMDKSNHNHNLLEDFDGTEDIPEDFSTFPETSNSSFRLEKESMNKKRKRGSPCSSAITNDKTETLTKNMALFDLAKILSSPTDEEFDFSQNPETISDYLDVLKQKEAVTTANVKQNFDDISNEELLKNVTTYKEKLKDVQKTGESSVDEILNLGYDFMIKDGTHWIDALGDNYEEVVEKEDVEENAMEQNGESSESEYLENTEAQAGQSNSRLQHEQYADSQMRRYSSRHASSRFRRNYNYDGSPKRYQRRNSGAVHQSPRFVPENVNPDYVNHPVFNSYYNYYSDVLSNTSSTFEDVSSFNRWFGEWETQLDSVTDYVAENIYLEEMNKFQYDRWYN